MADDEGEETHIDYELDFDGSSVEDYSYSNDDANIRFKILPKRKKIRVTEKSGDYYTIPRKPSIEVDLRAGYTYSTYYGTKNCYGKLCIYPYSGSWEIAHLNPVCN